MKKITGYILLMVIVVIFLPLFIVRSCGYVPEPDEYEQKLQEGTIIKVYDHLQKKVVDMDLEQYLLGVVAAEMPAEFELEALKAQAIAARTYALGRLMKVYVPKTGNHEGADICTDSTHCQAWVSRSQKMKDWGFFTAGRNWRKIVSAVSETEGIILMYQGKIANPLFHANSGGRTENNEEVWEGDPVPYLRGVLSEGEDRGPQYENAVEMKEKDFISVLKGKYPDLELSGSDILDNIKIESYTAGGRVKYVSVGDILIKGTEFRTIFSLKSANFKLEKAGKDTIRITTYGFGHGVGMSQYGANHLAKGGMSCYEILKYYYTGIELVNIGDKGEVLE